MNVKNFHAKKQPLLGQNNNALVMLIVINALIFIILNFLKIVYFLSYDDAITANNFFQKQILNWFTLPPLGEKLLYKPWTLFTYMFTNISILGIISTSLWLWAFGYILQDLTGYKKIFPIYIYGGFAGAVLFFLSANLFPAFYQNITSMPNLLGGGAAVMAIAVATTTLAPDYRLFPLINGGIPLWVLTVIFVAIDYASIAESNGCVAIAHLAGGVVGFIFIQQLRKGNDWSIWMNNLVDWFNNLFNPDKNQVLHNNKNSTSTLPQKNYTITQQKLDEILDKINTSGYHTLSKDEKDFLKKASKEEL